MRLFEIGKTYYMFSVCNSDCVWKYTVIARTKSTVTLKDEDGKITVKRIAKKVSEYFNVETIHPLGVYSMAPSLTADRLA